ncbi:MAG: J domain-containing protein [Halalkalicoccus sp.]
METLYDALGVEPDASSEEIRRAYREAAKRHHPDRPEGSSKEFRRLTTARDVLLDERRRERYDALGHSRYARHYLGEEWSTGDPADGHQRPRARRASAATRQRRSRRASPGRGTRERRRTRDARRDRPPRRSGPADGVVAVWTYWPYLVRAGLVLAVLLTLALVLAAL